MQDLIPYDYDPFVDDVSVKGPMSQYNDEEVFPGVHWFVIEHIQSLDRMLVCIKRARCTISRTKSQFCMDRIKIVGYICGVEGKSPDTAKVIKILE